MTIARAEEVLELAGRQDGLVTRGQLLKLAVSRWQIERRVRNGAWEQMLPGVFRDIRWPKTPWQQMRAALFWAGPPTCLSHTSAAAVWGLTRIGQGPVHVTAPHNLIPPVAWIESHRRHAVPKRVLREREGLCLTSPSRTLLDLAARTDGDELERLVHEAVKRGLTSPDDLHGLLSSIVPRSTPGAARLARVVELLSPDQRRQEELERRLGVRFRRKKLPTPACQYRVIEADHSLGIVDFAWPESKVIVEADSFQFHARRQQWSRDIDRYNTLMLKGWLVIRLTWSDVERESEIVFENLRRTIRSRRRELSPTPRRAALRQP